MEKFLFTIASTPMVKGKLNNLRISNIIVRAKDIDQAMDIMRNRLLENQICIAHVALSDIEVIHDKSIEVAVRDFITYVQKEYPDINMAFSYDEENDEYEIYHYNHENDNPIFQDFMGGLIKDLFFEKGIFNISVCCKGDQYI